MSTKKRREAVKKHVRRGYAERKRGVGSQYRKKTDAPRKSHLITRKARIEKIALPARGSAAFTTRIRAIGNSRGVILNNQLIEKAGLDPNMDIVIEAANGAIIIVQVKEQEVNTDLSTWDQQFQAAIKKGQKPEKDLFEAMENDFDSKDW
jgi:antitoxin component of MazEF toxin-antitoxin module